MADDKLSQGLQAFPSKYGGSGVVWVGNKHHLGLIGHTAFEGIHVKLVAVGRIQGDRDRNAAHQRGVEKVAGIAWVGYQHLIAGVEEDRHGIEQP